MYNELSIQTYKGESTQDKNEWRIFKASSVAESGKHMVLRNKREEKTRKKHEPKR